LRALGYERFWVSEHHNHRPSSTAPEIVIAAIAATTQRIRVERRNHAADTYSPFKVAEFSAF